MLGNFTFLENKVELKLAGCEFNKDIVKEQQLSDMSK